MPAEDALNWNRRYQNISPDQIHTPRAFLLEHIDLLPVNGYALDVAMGAGRNIPALLNRGLTVIGVDISIEAVILAKKHYPQVRGVVSDLTQMRFPDHYFDAIINFYYLQRELWKEFPRILKPGGVLVFESLTQPMRDVRPSIPPERLLAERELEQAFRAWEILVYREGWSDNGQGKQKATASMVARLPLNWNMESRDD